jgi:O-antigen/teichoic acid export membrane protein
MVLKKLASQTVVYGLSTMVGRFFNFLLVPLYTAQLGSVADYGEVNVIFSYAGFLAVIFTYGMETGFFNFARQSEKPNRVFSTATLAICCSGILLFLIASLFAEPLIGWAGYPGKAEYIYWFSAILAADAIASLFFAWLRYTEKPWNFALIRLTNIGVNIVFNLFFILLCPWLIKNGYSFVSGFFDPKNLVQYIFISNLISSVIILPLFGKSWKLLAAGFDAALFRKMLRYSLPMVVVGLAGMMNETMDRILLKHLLPEQTADHEAGIYGAFYKLSMVMTLFVQAFRFAAEPFFFSHAHKEDARQNYAYVLKWFVYICGAIYVITMVLLPWLGPLLIRNAEYFNDSRGLGIVPILLLANLFLGIYYNLSTWYKLSNKTHIGAWIAVAGAAITLAGNFYGIPRWGFEACAWTTLLTYFSMVAISYFVGQKHYLIPYPLFQISITIALSALLGYLAHAYIAVVPLISYLAIPAFLIVVWFLEMKKYVANKNP